MRRRSQISVDILLIFKIRIRRGWIGSHWWLSASLLCTAEEALWLQVVFCAQDPKYCRWEKTGRLNTLRWCRPFLDPSIFSLSSHREINVFLYSQRKRSRSQTKRYQHQSCTFSTYSKPGEKNSGFEKIRSISNLRCHVARSASSRACIEIPSLDMNSFMSNTIFHFRFFCYEY